MDLFQFDILPLFRWINIYQYPFVLLGIFLAWSFRKKHRSELIEYLESFNILTCWIGISFALYSLLTIFDMSSFEGETGYSFRIGVVQAEWWLFYLLKLSLFLGLLWKNLRRSFKYSLLLGALISLQGFLILMSNLLADFLPVAFTLRFEQLQSLLFYGLAAFVVYLIRRKRSRGL